jgi:excisionase family DNA binding protein
MAMESENLRQHTGVTNGDRLVKKSTAAMKLGVSIRTIDRLIHKGVLEKVFVGSAPRLRLSQLDRLIEKGS